MEDHFRIALLSVGIYPYDIGGIQKHTYYLAKYFAKNFIKVDLFYAEKKHQQEIKLHDYFDPEELNFINFIEVEYPKLPNIPGHYIYAARLFSQKIYIKLVGTNNSYAAIYAQGFTSWYFLKQKGYQSKLITNLHGLEMFQTSINLKHRIGRLMLQIPARAIIRNSEKQISLGGKLTQILYQHGARRNSVIEIPNGVDESWLSGIKNLKRQDKKEKIKFVFVGRYERRKGIEEFHAVINQTIARLNYTVTFVGPIPPEKQIKYSNVHYMGIIKDSDLIKQQLLNADILVCPSYSEGMPTVILEAMACGCAIIATDVGATNILVSEDNGWIIKNDIVSGLKKALCAAVKLSTEELELKKENSIKKVKNKFTWNKVIEKTIKNTVAC